MKIVEEISRAMSLRPPQREALARLHQVGVGLDYRNTSKDEAAAAASKACGETGEIRVRDDFHFPSFCFDMATGIGKTRLMGAAIYYLYRTRGYRHFFILTPGNTVYDKLRAEAVPGHSKYLFRGLEAQMGRPWVYDGGNYLSYRGGSEGIELFIFNIGKIFNRGDVQFKFHGYQERLGGSFADVLKGFDDLVICMDEAHRYYAPASMKAVDYLNPILGLEFTATPKKGSGNVIYRYGLEQGAGTYLKVPVVTGRTDVTGLTAAAVERMKLEDGIRLHERRKQVAAGYCEERGLKPVKPIVLIACRDTAHAKRVRRKVESRSFFGGRYRGRVIQIDSSTGAEETEENIRKLLTIERSDNPVEIVLHVYQLKEGWDVNNLFTIIPLNAARSEVLALQTIGRGLRLPFGQITGVEELDTLDIVAHDHYRDIVEGLKEGSVFGRRNLDEREIPDRIQVTVELKSSDRPPVIRVPKLRIGYSTTLRWKPCTVSCHIPGFVGTKGKGKGPASPRGGGAVREPDAAAMLACRLIDLMPELCAEDAVYVLDAAWRYLNLWGKDEEQRAAAVRRRGPEMANDLMEQIYGAMEVWGEKVAVSREGLVEFGSFVKHIRPDGRVDRGQKIDGEIGEYLFGGYRKSCYAENAFDRQAERELADRLDGDERVLCWMRPPKNRMGLYYRAGRQYTPDFLVETADMKYLIEVEEGGGSDTSESWAEIKEAAALWCKCAGEADPDGKRWEFRSLLFDC